MLTHMQVVRSGASTCRIDPTSTSLQRYVCTGSNPRNPRVLPLRHTRPSRAQTFGDVDSTPMATPLVVDGSGQWYGNDGSWSRYVEVLEPGEVLSYDER